MELISNYPVPEPVGLYDRIVAAGHAVWTSDGERYASNASAVQDIINAYTVADAKAEKCSRVLAKSKELRDRVTATIAPGEMAAWSIKRDEAIDFGKLGDAAACPALRAEALARQVSLGELVAKVNANAARFMAAEAAIGGTDGRHRDAINALTTFEEVSAYDYNIGWPEV